MKIRTPTRSDLAQLRLVVEDCELFPVEMLEGMMSPFFDEPDCLDRWLVTEAPDRQVTGLAYFRPEPLTEGTWNLLALGFRKGQRGKGRGARLVAAVEQQLAEERMLIVETSSLDAFEAARRFYEGCGFGLEAVIRDYWSAGDDKVIFRKPL
ncbi:MAG: GNAT family N-acetyltransferase [Pseudomonadota bacterium]